MYLENFTKAYNKRFKANAILDEVIINHSLKGHNDIKEIVREYYSGTPIEVIVRDYRKCESRIRNAAVYSLDLVNRYLCSQ